MARAKKKSTPPSWPSINLNNPSFFEDRVGAVFIDSLNSSSGERESDSFLKFRDVNALFLEIGVLPNKPGRIKLGSASAV